MTHKKLPLNDYNYITAGIKYENKTTNALVPHHSMLKWLNICIDLDITTG